VQYEARLLNRGEGNGGGGELPARKEGGYCCACDLEGLFKKARRGWVWNAELKRKVIRREENNKRKERRLYSGYKRGKEGTWRKKGKWTVSGIVRQRRKKLGAVDKSGEKGR